MLDGAKHFRLGGHDQVVRDLETRFVEVYEAAYTDLVRFAARRGDPGHAEDIVAEAFTIAWRRSADLPRGLDEARAWLFGIARNLLMAKHRKDAHALAVRVCDPRDPSAAELGHEDAVISALDLVAAWGRLSAGHQEALSLTVWEGLTSAQAATVLNISPVAYRIRLSRARKALTGLLAVLPRPHHERLTRVEEGQAHER